MSRAGSEKTHRTTTAVSVFGALVALVALAACGSGSTTPTTSTTTKAASGPGTVYRWGVVGTSGKIAQLELTAPTPVAGITGRVTQIATSNSDGYVLTSNGEVFAWGVNNYGELGNGTTSPYETHAVQVEFPSGVTIATLANPMPFDGALAIDSNHHVWAWGLNGTGDLCLTGLAGHEALRPVELSLGDVTLATGARTHSLFDSGGRVYACGSGDAESSATVRRTPPRRRPRSSACPRSVSPHSPPPGRAPVRCSRTATTTTGATTWQGSSATARRPTARCRSWSPCRHR